MPSATLIRATARVGSAFALVLIGACSAHASTDKTAPPVSSSTPSTSAPTTTTGPPDPALKVRAVPILSAFETPTRAVQRDIGISVALPDGHVLWLFGDTRIDERNRSGSWDLTDFVDGSSGALEVTPVPGQVGLGQEYPAATPTRFIPVPTNVYLSDGSGRACVKGTSDAAYSARWPTGAALMPADNSEVLVTYSEVCVTYPPGGTPASTTEGWGYLLYNWRTAHIDTGPVDVVAPQTDGAEIAFSRQLGWPTIENGKVTLFSSQCTPQYLGCRDGRVWSVTMAATTAALGNPASYKLQALSTERGPLGWDPLSISVGRYPGGLRLVEWTSITGTYKIFSAPSLDAPWHLEASGALPGCRSRTLFCFAVDGHPELSTRTDLFVSYDDPDAGPTGHVVISALPDHR